LSYTTLNYTCHRRARVQIVIIIQRPTTIIYYTEHEGPFVRMCDRRYILRFSVSGPQRTTFFLKINIAFFHSVLLSHSSRTIYRPRLVFPLRNRRFGHYRVSFECQYHTSTYPHTHTDFILYYMPDISFRYLYILYNILSDILLLSVQCLTQKINSKDIGYSADE